MTFLGSFKQQPNEIIDYDFDFGPWIEARSDALASYTVAVDPAGLNTAASKIGNVVKVVVSGGTDGARHKITVLGTTAAALKKEAEIRIRIKEV